jgi:uncharacterized phage-associated protein
MYNQSINNFSFNYKKAVASLLFVAKDVHNLYNIVKIFYFADKEHLRKYGRFIFGDTYIAMENGQMPSNFYDMIKFVRGDGGRTFDESLKDLIDVKNKYLIKTKKEPDLDYLSPSDIECLTKSIHKYGKMSFPKLREESHLDKAYLNTRREGEIKLDKIIDTLENKDKIKTYLNHLYD